MSDFAREVDEHIYPALNPGEQVLWKGHCLSRLGKQRKATPAAALPEVVLAIVLAAVAMFATAVITKIGILSIGAAIATFVLAIRLTDRYFEHWGTDDAVYCRKQTVYVLTNQRAIVLRHCRTANPVQSLLWAYADEVRAESVGLDGRGSVQFLSWHPVERRWVHSLQFFMVGDARYAAQRAIEARDAARG